MSDTIMTLLRYKDWADELTFASLAELPPGEANKSRQTNFGTMINTLNHVFVVDDIFRHHLEGRQHTYTSRSTPNPPPLPDLLEQQRAMNDWLINFAGDLDAKALSTIVRFQFVGGGEGAMTREQIFLHLVNHATYHRGFVNDMMYQVPAQPPANDVPVFLREAARGSDHAN